MSSSRGKSAASLGEVPMTPATPRHAHGYAIASGAIALILGATLIASVVAR